MVVEISYSHRMPITVGAGVPQPLQWVDAT